MASDSGVYTPISTSLWILLPAVAGKVIYPCVLPQALFAKIYFYCKKNQQSFSYGMLKRLAQDRQRNPVYLRWSSSVVPSKGPGNEDYPFLLPTRSSLHQHQPPSIIESVAANNKTHQPHKTSIRPPSLRPRQPQASRHIKEQINIIINTTKQLLTWSLRENRHVRQGMHTLRGIDG